MSQAQAWGVDGGYHDGAGRWHPSPPQTVDAVLAALGAGDQPPPAPSAIVARPGEQIAQTTVEITTEDGRTLTCEGVLPGDFPLGYHRLHRAGHEQSLIVCPPRCHLPADLHTWGLAVQLYAARSRSSWGIGDLADLRRIARWSAGRGAGIVLVNPLHATAPTLPQETSPYFPTSRRWRNPLMISVDEIPGAEAVAAPQRESARQLNSQRQIDRDAVFGLKLGALHELFAAGAGGDGLDGYRATEGAELELFATWCAIAEELGSRWIDWPEELRRPGPEARRFAAAHEDRVRFHAWLQWVLDRQLAQVGGEIGLMQDLAIGVDRHGYDTWRWADAFASGFSVGVPPDDFNTQGQNWSQPPLDPWKLRSCGYAPYIGVIRAAFAHAGALRIDHVMGLFRLFWIPEGAGPGDGVFVRYPHRELLDILALESVRAGAFVVGEDLGTVEPVVREEMAARDILSYRLLWFEPEPPERYPRRAMTAITTHDLPTIAGLWSGADLEEQHHLRLEPNSAGTAEMRDRLARAARAGDGVPVEDLIAQAHHALATAPSMVVSASLDDCAVVEERPNMPGTTSDVRDNWSIALPRPLEEILAAPLAERVAEALRR